MKSELTDIAEISSFGDQISTPFTLTAGFFDQFAVDAGDRNSSPGFMEMLGIHDFSSNFLLDPLPVSFPPEFSEVVNLPATPNESSISSSSIEAPTDADPSKGAVNATEDADADEDLGKEKKDSTSVNKGKKKGQKRQREPRFAFLTKSDVDHLEDGYRWRKYGQKAVKNSPYPRSYYRCTTATCGVKKRVERSSKDSAVVVTTYEGQHTHPCPVMPRGSHLMHQGPTMPDRFGVPQPNESHLPFFNSYLPTVAATHLQPSDFRHVVEMQRRQCNPTAPGVSITDHGLLQDLIPLEIRKFDQENQN